MTDHARLLKLIDQQTFQRLQARARSEWYAQPQPFQPLDLEPYLREVDGQIGELARLTHTPKWLIEVPTVSMATRRPRLQDRLWSRFQAARRLLLRTIRR